MTYPHIVTGADRKARDKHITNLLGQYHIPDSNRLIIEEDEMGIEAVRHWQRWLFLTGRDISAKALVVRNADKLSPEAQNAFLKTLEEPPANRLIILESGSADRLLPTIHSRCLVDDLGYVASPQDQESRKKILTNLTAIQGGTGDKFRLAQDLARDRSRAVDFLDELASFCHTEINQGNFSLTGHIRAILEAKKDLLANTNVRLTLENLFLDW